MLSRYFRSGTTLLLLGLMASTASAQPGGGRGPGMARGPGGMGGGATELLGLLSTPEIRKEVKLSDEGYAAVEKAQQESQEAMRSMFRGFGQDASEADREKARTQMQQKMKEFNDKSQALLDEVLPPEGLERLMGLFVQLRGDSGVTNDLVSKKVGLTDDDKKKVQDAIDKVREDMRASFGGRGPGGAPEGGRDAGGAPGGGRGPGGFDPEQMRARMEEMTKKTNDAVAAVLTEPQKKALEALKGAKFQFPENMGRGGFGGFGGRGPGGPGGPGAPGGQGAPGGRRGGRPGSESGT